MLAEHSKAAKRTALAATAIAALLLVATLLSARSALAEATLVRTAPPADSILAEAPARVEMWFDQPLAPAFAATEVTLALAGAPTEIRPLYAAVDHRDPTRLIISPPQALNTGRYVIKWRITSAQDDSVSQGEYAFVISPSAAPVSSSEGEGGPDVLFLSLITLAGIGGGTFLGLLLYLFRRALGFGGHPVSEGTLPEHH
jgi:methionine-rich copper-binding protein CopC